VYVGGFAGHRVSQPARQFGSMPISDRGFSITGSVFGRGEMHRVCQALATADLPRTQAGVRNTLCVPAVRELAENPDLVALAATFIDEQPMKGGVLQAIAPASALAMVVALRVHLDDSTPANGPLRVLPRTHAIGVLTNDEIQRMAATITPVTCVASAGGVVAMRPLVVHASSKASDNEPRRVLHIEYATSVHLGAGIELAVG
jgi:phytanoyl-CoA dioxygenase PhyH